MHCCFINYVFMVANGDGDDDDDFLNRESWQQEERQDRKK